MMVGWLFKTRSVGLSWLGAQPPKRRVPVDLVCWLGWAGGWINTNLKLGLGRVRVRVGFGWAGLSWGAETRPSGWVGGMMDLKLDVFVVWEGWPLFLGGGAAKEMAIDPAEYLDT